MVCFLLLLGSSFSCGDSGTPGPHTLQRHCPLKHVLSIREILPQGAKLDLGTEELENPRYYQGHSTETEISWERRD